jgi:hypothetical protein
MPRQRAKKWSKNRYSYSAYLLYWYKSTNTDVALAPQLEAGVTSLEQDEARELIMSHLVYLLYWYKSTNTDVSLAPQLEAGVTSLEQDEARELMSHLAASASSSSREDQLRGIEV